MRWFTGDQHFGHRKLAPIRGFSSLDAMHAAIVERHNAVVSPGDDVYHLGDFAMDPRIVSSMLGMLVGRHHLVSGNHDRCHPCHARHMTAARRYLDAGFIEVDDRLDFIIESIGPVALSHLPYLGDRTEEDRLPELRPRPGGERCLLHGHVHDAWRVKWIELAGVSSAMINVGVDVWGLAPVGVDALVSVLEADG